MMRTARENTMKITDVACHILQCKVAKPFVSARGWV
jgi:D-galactarolactone cycloisomerase